MKILKILMWSATILLISISSAQARLQFGISLAVEGFIYKLKPLTSSTSPDIVTGSYETYAHEMIAVGFNPNNVKMQRRIIKAWSENGERGDAGCVNSRGEESSCQWIDWNVDWDFVRDMGNSHNMYRAVVSVPGDAYENWPLFETDLHWYPHHNPNLLYIVGAEDPKTVYHIEVRAWISDETEWFYGKSGFAIYCNGEQAWSTSYGDTNCN